MKAINSKKKKRMNKELDHEGRVRHKCNHMKQRWGGGEGGEEGGEWEGGRGGVRRRTETQRRRRGGNRLLRGRAGGAVGGGAGGEGGEGGHAAQRGGQDVGHDDRAHATLLPLRERAGLGGTRKWDYTSSWENLAADERSDRPKHWQPWRSLAEDLWSSIHIMYTPR